MASIEVSQEQMEHMVSNQLTAGISFRLNLDVINLLGVTTACVLGLFIELHKAAKKDYPENNGWFSATYAEQQDLVDIPMNALKRAKKQLITTEIITMIKHGAPCMEFYRINFTRLYELLS